MSETQTPNPQPAQMTTVEAYNIISEHLNQLSFNLNGSEAMAKLLQATAIFRLLIKEHAELKNQANPQNTGVDPMADAAEDEPTTVETSKK